MATSAVQDDGWQTIGDESGLLIKWGNPGERFIGIFEGIRHIKPPESTDPDEEFDQQLFRSNEDGTDAGDILYALNGGYKVREALTDEYVGYLTMLTYVKDIPTGQPSPMKDIKVQVKPL